VKRYRRSITLFLVAFAVYNANLRPIPAGDTAPASLLPFVILGEHTFQLDRFRSWYADSQHMDPVWFRMGRDGHYYSAYSITLPLLITPLYAPVVKVLNVPHQPPDRILLWARVMEKFSASLIAALSVGLFLVLVEKFTDPQAALLLTVVYGFASQTWSTSSQALWQHGATELSIILALLFLILAGSEGVRGFPAGAGLLAGLAVVLRLVSAIFSVMTVLYVLGAGWKLSRKVGFLSSALVLPLCAIAYNRMHFANTLAGVRVDKLYSVRPLIGIAGLLFSPSRGLFIFSPVFIFAVCGAYFWFRGANTPYPEIYRVCILSSGAYIFALGSLRVWHGGYCYGPRMLADIVPCLVILLVPVMDRVARSPLWRTAFLAALAFSIAVQGIGVFFYPKGHWDALPASIDHHRERVWDWRDSQIARSASSGPVTEPYRLAFRFLAHPRSFGEDSLKREGLALW